MPFSIHDMIALAWFVAAWTAYAVLLEYFPHRREGLNARMNAFRAVWMRRMLDREMRMVDMQIMAALQNGTAFFASTSLIAVGGALTLLRSTDEILQLVAALPFGITTTSMQWEAKTMRHALISVHAFVKFALAQR